MTELMTHRLADGWRRCLRYKTTRIGECWIWNGPINQGGYGRSTFGNRWEQLVHRLSYRLYCGEIADDLTIDHLCRNKLCVNPAHLEVVSHRENILRGDTVAARKAQQTHCVHGHEFTFDNTYLNAKGNRQCIACRDAYNAMYYEKTKAARL